MKTVILFSFIILFGKVFCQKAPKDLTLVRDKYKDSLQKAINTFKEGKTPKIKLIEFCIPETSDEFLLFFGLDYQKENSPAFNSLNAKILEEAASGNESVLRKYLAMSQFVDGYFAEAYFDHVEGIAQKQKVLFCKTINSLPKEKTKELSEIKSNANFH